jgi:hypothetical protein
VSIVQLRTKLEGQGMISHRAESGIGRQEMIEERMRAVARDVRDVNTETLGQSNLVRAGVTRKSKERRTLWTPGRDQ